jgi:O-antigen/teichoic acid export membrane protein
MSFLLLKERVYSAAKLQNRSVLTSAITLISGTGAAQLIGLMALPILTRFYTPDEFGLFAVYGAILSLISVLVCLRYELAVVLPKTARVALLVVRLCLFATVFVSLLSVMLLVFAEDVLCQLYAIDPAANWLWLIPVSLLVGGLYKTATFWHTREKNYKRLACAKISQSVPQVMVQLLLGFTPLGILGLILGEIIGKACGAISLWVKTDELTKLKKNVTARRLNIVAGTYKKFPLVSSWSVLINQFGVIAPALAIAAYFGAEVAGWYAMAQRILGIPMDLIGQAILSLYVGEASAVKRQSPSQLKSLYLNYLSKMFMLGAIVVVVIVAAGDWLFLTFLGGEWGEAAVYAKILVVGFWFRFAVCPLSQTLNLIGCQDIQLYWDLGRLTMVFACFIYIFAESLSPLAALIVYTGVVIMSQTSHAVITLYQLGKFSS